MNIPGDPRKCSELVFNNFKSSKDRTKSLDGKEAEFYENVSDINDLKIRPYNPLISKNGQNAEKSGIWLLSNYFRDLLSENVHIITKRNGLNPNVIPHINAGELWNASISDM